MESEDKESTAQAEPENSDETREDKEITNQSNIPESDVIKTEPTVEGPNTSNSSSSITAATTSSPVEIKKKEKIYILLKPVGDAPILKTKLWAVEPERTISSVLLFIKPRLRLEGDQSVFLFVNQAFAPSPDQLIRNLYECFGSDGKLILNYSTTTAWG